MAARPLRKALPSQENAGSSLVQVCFDKVGSATGCFELKHCEMADPNLSRVGSGDLVAVRVLSGGTHYNRIELPNGRIAKVNRGDTIAGVLGKRRALKAFVAEVPEQLQAGDRLHLVGLGGIIGLCTGRHHTIGEPFEVETIGMIQRNGRTLRLAERALPSAVELNTSAPIILVTGSSMNSGKTEVASQLIKGFCASGKRVAAAKLTGLACLKDTLNMQDHGACPVLSFLDCGYPSTVGLDDIGSLAVTLLSELNQSRPQLIVLELGDGLLGGYRVDSLFRVAPVMEHCAAIVFCAPDFVAAWGGCRLLERWNRSVDIISGSCTDSAMGVEFIERELAVPAANALRGSKRLFELAQRRVESWKESR